MKTAKLVNGLVLVATFGFALCADQGASAGWFEDLTGQPTPEPIRKIAPNGFSYTPPPPVSSNLPMEDRPLRACMPNGGCFVPNGGTWNEFDANGVLIFVFRRVGENANFIYIRDDQRRLVLAIPRQNGVRIGWQWEGQNFTAWAPVTWRR